MALRFLTKYYVGSSAYGGDVWAKDAADARRICRLRGIGEEVIGFGRKTGGLKRPVTKLEKLHEAIYLGWIALETKRMTPEELLGDRGIIHELVHALHGRPVKGLEKRFRRLQRSTPGHRP